MPAPPPPPKRPSSGKLGAVTGAPFGPFVLEERLAIGGTAEVWIARPAQGTQPAACLVVKRLLPALRDDPDARSMFAEEAAVHTRFDHPAIVRCHGAGEADGEPWLAMELVRGVDLHRVLRVMNAAGDAIPVGVACYVARQILAALGEVHSAVGDDFTPLAIVHRDVSPSNIYLSSEGDVKLGDFGIAKVTALKPRPGASGGLRGKIGYLAPEQVAEGIVDQRADLFAAANVLAEMCVGKPLFSGSGQLAILLAIRDVRLDVLHAAKAKLPPLLVSVLERALARSPSDRYHDAEDLSSALAPFALDVNAGRRELASLVRLAQSTHGDLRTPAPISSPFAGGALDPLRAAQPAAAPAPVATSPVTAPAPTPSVSQPTRPAEELATPVRAAILSDYPYEWGAAAAADDGPEPALSQRTTAPFSPAPSYVKTGDGRLLGPLTYAKLVELVATGRVEATDQVDFFGTGYVPLGDIEELARLLAPASATGKIEGPGTPVWQGLAAEHYDANVGGAVDPGISAALAFIAHKRHTGALMAQAEGRRKEIYFVNGRLFHVATSESTELLGEYLVARGLLDRADLDLALAVLPRFNGRIGEALTGLGLLEPMKMFRVIQEQGRDRVAELFAWSEGTLAFYEGAHASKVEFPMDLPIGPIVEAGVARMLDDRRASARWAPWVDRKLVLAEASAGVRDAGWSPRVEQVLKLAKVPIAARTLLRSLAVSGSTAHDAARAVEAARLAGLLRWVDG